MSLPKNSDARVGGFDRNLLARYLAEEVSPAERQAIDEKCHEDETLRNYIRTQRRTQIPWAHEELLDHPSGTRRKLGRAIPLVTVAAGVLFAVTAAMNPLFRGPSDGPNRTRGEIGAEIVGLVGGKAEPREFSQIAADEEFGLLVNLEGPCELSVYEEVAGGALRRLYRGEVGAGQHAAGPFERKAGAIYWLKCISAAGEERRLEFR